MEHHDPSRRQYVPQNYTTQQQQSALASTAGQYANQGTAERFRQPVYLQEPPSTPPSAVRGGSEAQQVYGFSGGTPYGAGSALPSSSLQYGQELQTPETQRQQAQTYPQYGQHVLYSMGQPQPGPTPYEQSSRYQPRTNTASETLGSQFGVAQSGQYYLAGQSAQPNTSASELAPPPLASQYAQQDPYPQPGPSAGQPYPQPGPSTGQPYPTSMMDPSQSAQYQSYVQQNQYQSQPQQSLDQDFERYENQIRTIFMLAREGSLRDIGSHLIDVSVYLLGNAEGLGLTRDEQTLHDIRVRLWTEFNRAWLVSLQTQLDMTQEMMRTNQQVREPQSIMNTQTLERLGQELVRLCDIVEKHGLVDYEIGVAEEEIIDLLLRCVALLEPPEVQFDPNVAQNQPSAPSTTRGR